MDVEVIPVDDEDEEIFSQEAQEQQPPASALVDLTRTNSAAGPAEPKPVASFEQEYHVLRSAAQGFEPPLEAIAELLLRHPQHWWCRCVMYCAYFYVLLPHSRCSLSSDLKGPIRRMNNDTMILLYNGIIQ